MADNEDTTALIADRTAVVTMECQRGVIGDLAIFPALGAAAAEAGVVDAVARVVSLAHHRGVPVVHAVFAFDDPPDPETLNAPLLRTAARRPIMAGSDAAAVAPGIGPRPDDLISTRSSGVSPFTRTGLDRQLADLGIGTLVVCGASLNVGIPGLCVEAVNLGYRVVVPTDAVVGLPVDFGRDVITHGIAQLATLVTVDELDAAWSGPAA